MTPAIAIKLARLQAENPGKTYAECCAMLGRRRKKKVAPKIIGEQWWNKD